jgi:hypothetical protein
MGDLEVSTDLQALATEAYTYGFPLVFGLDHVRRRSELGPLQPAPVNMFSHARKVSGPEDRFVYINNDTIYSIAQVDVSGQPLLLTVPDTADRYYVLQFIDAWTNVFAYIGRRVTGTKTGTFLLIPPGWAQEPPAGVPVIEFPTTIGTIIARWACSGPDDLYEVRMLQSELSLEPYGPRSPQFGVPEPASVPRMLGFFERMRTWMQAFPPIGEDREYAEQFAPLGLLDPETPYRNCPPDLATALTEGRDLAEQRVASVLRDEYFLPQENGWALNYHLFDYNIDYLGIGTLNEPSWKITDRMAGYQLRSLAAHSDLWGNHGYEIASPMTSVDTEGNQLNGRNSYALTFDTQPPTDAFWSLTMYKQPDFYLVSNPAERYSIGSRTPGLLLSSNGSLTIQIQHEAPHDPSNWLPAPAAPFRLVLRVYQPTEALLSGAYTLPPVMRTHLMPTA